MKDSNTGIIHVGVPKGKFWDKLSELGSRTKDQSVYISYSLLQDLIKIADRREWLNQHIVLIGFNSVPKGAMEERPQVTLIVLVGTIAGGELGGILKIIATTDSSYKGFDVPCPIATEEFVFEMDDE